MLFTALILSLGYLCLECDGREVKYENIALKSTLRLNKRKRHPKIKECKKRVPVSSSLTTSMSSIFRHDGSCFPRGWGGEGNSGFQVTGMIEWGGGNQNPNKSLDQDLTPKNPVPNFRAINISRKH